MDVYRPESPASNEAYGESNPDEYGAWYSSSGNETDIQ